MLARNLQYALITNKSMKIHECLRQSLLKKQNLNNRNTMVIITLIENTSILLAFVVTLHTHQNLTSATTLRGIDVKFTIGGPLAWSNNEKQMSRNRKSMMDKRN